MANSPTRLPLDDMLDSDLLHPRQVCAHLDISRETFRKICIRGDLHRVIFAPRFVRIRVGDLRAYITRSTEGARDA